MSKTVNHKEQYIKHIDPIDTDALHKVLFNSFSEVYDFEFVILKGHMMVEYAINLIIDKLTFNRANAITSWQFKNKLIYIDSLGMFEGKEGGQVLEQIQALTNIRNSIAHTLGYDEKDLHNLVKYYPTIRNNIRGYKHEEFKKAFDHEGAEKRFTGHLIYYIIPFLFKYLVFRLNSRICLHNECYLSLKEESVASWYGNEAADIKKHLQAIETSVTRYP